MSIAASGCYIMGNHVQRPKPCIFFDGSVEG